MNARVRRGARGPASLLATVVLCALAVLAPAGAGAGPIGIPSAPNCTFPRIVPLVGHQGALADSATGHFEIVVRDLANIPLGWVTVILELTDAAEFRIASDQLDPRLHVLCASRTVYTFADRDGVARFTLVGGGRYPPGPAVKNRALRVSIDGAPLATLPVCALDMNGSGGVALNDLQLWSADFFGSLHPTRADFDGDGLVGLRDLSLWAAVFFEGRSVQSADAYCP